MSCTNLKPLKPSSFDSVSRVVLLMKFDILLFFKPGWSDCLNADTELFNLPSCFVCLGLSLTVKLFILH